MIGVFALSDEWQFWYYAALQKRQKRGDIVATELSEIKSNARVKLTGDVHISGSIGKGAVITVQDGNLTVDGNVDDGAQITLNQNGKRKFWSNSIVFTADNHKLISIKGSVGSNATIKALSADIRIDGDVGENSQITAYKGNIDVKSAPASAKMGTFYGDVLAAGVKRQQHSGGPSIYNSEGNLFVNGRDITRPASSVGNNEEGTVVYGTMFGSLFGAVALSVIGIILSIPIMPGILIFMGAVVVGGVIGGLIGCAINHAKSRPSIEFPANSQQQTDQISNSTTKLQRKMGGSTFEFHNDADSTIVQQILGGGAVVEPHVEEKREDERPLLAP